MADIYTLEDIENLYLRFGDQRHEASSVDEPVSVLEHALQCAQLAEWGGADEQLVAAAFLLDLGLLIPGNDDPLAGNDETRRQRSLPHLTDAFSFDVLEPIRMNVAAKRYLAATEAGYLPSLPPAIRDALPRQGGPMSPVEAARFEGSRFAREAVLLRRWDDQARVPGQRTPPLDYYLALLEDVQRLADNRGKLEVGPQTVS
jgi:predicted HD phosphohydrolase